MKKCRIYATIRNIQQYKISLYTTDDGKIPFLDWLENIKDLKIQRRIKLRIDRLIDGNFGDTKTVGNKLYELRLFFGAGYRIYYTIENNILIILFTGGDKSTQSKDIEKAKAFLQDYKGGNNAKQ